MRSLGDGRTPMIAIVIAALMNIVLDLAFVIGLRAVYQKIPTNEKSIRDVFRRWEQC